MTFLPTVFLVNYHTSLKDGVEMGAVDAVFQQLCRVLVQISDVLAVFACDFAFQRLLEPAEEFGRCVACLLLWPEAVWQIFKSVGIVVTKVIGKKDLIWTVCSQNNVAQCVVQQQ
jgi:hypothetical protein